MLQKALCAAVVVALGVSLATAEELRGSIKKVQKGKITVAMKFDKETKKFTEEKTLKVAKNVKVVKAKFNKETMKVEAGDELEGGLKNKRFTEIGERGIFATIVTNDDGLVTEIRIFEFRKKKSKD
ncbi:MAG: hypothetical protein FJ271_15335 [Planctomycetes bacterium]|nr:hypothetical protein [Planctomycetota bacterium]